MTFGLHVYYSHLVLYSLIRSLHSSSLNTAIPVTVFLSKTIFACNIDQYRPSALLDLCYFHQDLLSERISSLSCNRVHYHDFGKT